MSTRSAIAIKNPNGTIESIYCHFDGYPEYVGKLLVQYYNTEDKIRSLINLGDICCLKARLAPDEGEEHTCDNKIKDVTVAYHRDCGEPYEEPVIADSEEDWCKAYDYDMEYWYLFEDGRWAVNIDEEEDDYDGDAYISKSRPIADVEKYLIDIGVLPEKETPKDE